MNIAIRVIIFLVFVGYGMHLKAEKDEAVRCQKAIEANAQFLSILEGESREILMKKFNKIDKCE